MINAADFSKWLRILLDETFGVAHTPQGFMLETGRSGLLGTLEGVSAEVASSAAGPEEATVASHCSHILFLLQHFAAHERGEPSDPDWEGSWATRAVDRDAWDALRHELQTTYDAVVTQLQARHEWPEPAVAAAMLLLAHSAYHLGEIRQRLSNTRRAVHE